MPTSNEREMLSSNEALKELTVVNVEPASQAAEVHERVTSIDVLAELSDTCATLDNNRSSFGCLVWAVEIFQTPHWIIKIKEFCFHLTNTIEFILMLLSHIGAYGQSPPLQDFSTS